MIYKVIKDYINPWTQKPVKRGETVEIPEQYIKGFLRYVEKMETVETAVIKPEEAKKQGRKRKVTEDGTD